MSGSRAESFHAVTTLAYLVMASGIALDASQREASVATWIGIGALLLASAVVLGALAWTVVLCVAVRLGARIFARPVWQVWTQALTAAVMFYFAWKLALRLLA